MVNGWFRPHAGIGAFLESYSNFGGIHHAALVYGGRCRYACYAGNLHGLGDGDYKIKGTARQAFLREISVAILPGAFTNRGFPQGTVYDFFVMPHKKPLACHKTGPQAVFCCYEIFHAEPGISDSSILKDYMRNIWKQFKYRKRFEYVFSTRPLLYAILRDKNIENCRKNYKSMI